MNRLDDAESIFKNLTQAHPELPEPFNNLAVVYAAKGNFDAAREALREAISTHPAYATAHENMGDIYAKMAVVAYNEALQLDSGNQTAREKLALVNDLFSVRVKEKIEFAEAKQAEAEKKIITLKKREQELQKIKAKTDKEVAESRTIRAELSRIQAETTEVVKKAKREQEEAEKLANQALVEIQ